MGEPIDDALATRCAVPVSLEPFEGEGRTGTVAQEAFEPGTVTGRDMDRGIDAEPSPVAGTWLGRPNAVERDDTDRLSR